MKRKLIAIVLLAGTPAFAHRLDEYLQGTILSIEKTSVQAHMTLTPGVAIFPFLIPSIDTDSNSVISETEQRAYADRVLRDLSLIIDGHHLMPTIASLRFPTIDEMKEGRGKIQLDFGADLPRVGRNRKLTLENHHFTPIAAYQVNCTVPSDPNIQIATQVRNYSQSSYVLEYVQTNVGPVELSAISVLWLSPIALLMFIRFAVVWLRRARRMHG
jgi:hypothetical protein